MKYNKKSDFSSTKIFDQSDTMTFPLHNKYINYYFQHNLINGAGAYLCYSLEDDTGRRYTEDYARTNHKSSFLGAEIRLKYEDNTVMNSGLLVLSYTFRNPHQVPYLLLPQPHVCKENTIMELQIRKDNITS